MTCPWKIRWTTGQDAACDLEEHVRPGVPLSEDQYRHHAMLRNYAYPGSVTELTWMHGDRREFTGDWPGPCTGKVPGCILHTGHRGRCAP